MAIATSAAKHQYRVPTVEPCPSRQMVCELLGLRWIEAQEEGRDDRSQAYPALDATVVDAVAHADTADDLWVVFDVLEHGKRCDVQVRVPLAREHASVAFDEHESSRGRGQRVQGRETVDVQHIGCIARRPVSITSKASSLTPRATTERTGMPAWTIVCRRLGPGEFRRLGSTCRRWSTDGD